MISESNTLFVLGEEDSRYGYKTLVTLISWNHLSEAYRFQSTMTTMVNDLETSERRILEEEDCSKGMES